MSGGESDNLGHQSIALKQLKKNTLKIDVNSSVPFYLQFVDLLHTGGDLRIHVFQK